MAYFCKTAFSFRYGTIGTEDLVAQAAAQGLSSLILTNINTTCDAWDFIDYCRQQRIQPIVGVEVRSPEDQAAVANDVITGVDEREDITSAAVLRWTRFPMRYVLLARSDEGLAQMHQFLSAHLQTGRPFPPVAQLGDEVFTLYPLSNLPSHALTANEFVLVAAAEVNKLFTVLQRYPHWRQDKLIIWQPVVYANREQYSVHKLLRAIDLNCLLSKLPPEQLAPRDAYWVPYAQLLQAFATHPYLITNTLQLLAQCRLTMPLHTDKNKRCFTASVEDDRILLEKLARDGFTYRYPTASAEVQQRLEKELQVIHRLGFSAYFLITWDIIRYAQSRGFYYVGRGSGANSVVAYCLQITDVDPIELDLYFERFLNPHRTSPPDFDIDFSWKDRDEVIDYVFKRYGREQVSLLGMYSTFQHQAIVRELGKVFGLPKSEIDRLVAKAPHYWSRQAAMPVQEAEDRYQYWIYKYGNYMRGLPNYPSIHPGGILISEAPITQYATVMLPPKGFATAQLDLFVAEKVGLFKLDILSQRGLGHIKEAIRLIRQNKGQHVDIHDVARFKRDVGVADQIRQANTIGCFYIESPAMRQLLRKLRCSDYLTLVAASSIIRPGVAQSGMMKAYIHRFHHPNSFQYIHPVMEKLLQETYGVMVYQEDVIKVAHHFAGLDMAEADILRRAMSGKYRSRKELDAIRDRYFANCAARGYSEAVSGEVWRQIESFSGYSFSKAHSASFAVESYQSLYLKTYYPMEFMVAVINNFGGFYTTELYVHELRKTGACIHAPCVNNSELYTTITGSDVYLGFIHVKGLTATTITTVLQERQAHGAYLHLVDFVERTRISKEQLHLFIRVGALRFTRKSKKVLLWEANCFLPATRATKSVALFDTDTRHFQLPVLAHSWRDDAMDEWELLGFPLCDVFRLLPATVAAGIVAAEMPHHEAAIVTIIGYLVTGKPVRTVKGEMMYFGTFLDRSGNWIDTVHFPDVLRRCPFQGKGFYQLTGKVTCEYEVYQLEVHEMNRIGINEQMASSAASVDVLV